jgi:hypothetical protein
LKGFVLNIKRLNFTLSKIKSMRTQTVKMGVQVSVNDVISVINSLNLTQKRLVYNKLRMDFFKEGFQKLSNEIKSPNFSEDEILAEVMAVRKNK